MIKILFVCHGNICRSPMAEFVMKDMVEKRGIAGEFYIASAATSTEEIGNDIHPGTKRKLAEQKIPFGKRAARQVARGDYDRFDYFIGMDSWNIKNILRLLKTDDEKKVSRLLDFTGRPRDIADPWYTGNFDETYADVTEGCEAFLEFLGFGSQKL